MKKLRLILLLPLLACCSPSRPDFSVDPNVEDGYIKIVEVIKMEKGYETYEFLTPMKTGDPLANIQWKTPYSDVYADIDFVFNGLYLDKEETTKLKASQYYTYDGSFKILYCDMAAYATINFGKYLTGEYTNYLGDKVTVDSNGGKGSFYQDWNFEFEFNKSARNSYDINLKNCILYGKDNTKDNPYYQNSNGDVINIGRFRAESESLVPDMNYLTLILSVPVQPLLEYKSYNYNACLYTKLSPVTDWDI